MPIYSDPDPEQALPSQLKLNYYDQSSVTLGRYKASLIIWESGIFIYLLSISSLQNSDLYPGEPKQTLFLYRYIESQNS
jgi:hypothetical protein